MSVVPYTPTPSTGRLILCVNGILTGKSSFAWNPVAARIAQKSGYWGDAFMYTTDVFTRDFRNANYVSEIHSILDYWDAGEVHLVAHSHGAALACKIVASGRRITSVHLIEGAVTGDCRKNGINEAITRGTLGGAYWYCSKDDDVLKYLATASEILPGIPDYGNGGWTGPTHAVERVYTHWWPEGFDHSTATSPAHLGDTMRLVLDNITTPPSPNPE